VDGLLYIVAGLIFASLFVSVLKGRYWIVLFSVLLPFVIYFGIGVAFRLATPTSAWAKIFYGPTGEYPEKFYESVFRFDRERFDRENMADSMPAGWQMTPEGRVVKSASAKAGSSTVARSSSSSRATVDEGREKSAWMRFWTGEMFPDNPPDAETSSSPEGQGATDRRETP
jgi:hypothetical protein